MGEMAEAWDEAGLEAWLAHRNGMCGAFDHCQYCDMQPTITRMLCEDCDKITKHLENTDGMWICQVCGGR